MIKKLRRIIQIILLLVFLYLILDIAERQGSDFFLKLSPLTGILTVLGTRDVVFEYLLPAIIVLVLSFLLGRFFCGWICPMGTTIDIFDRVVSPVPGKTCITHRWKYIIFIFLLILSLAGISLAGLFDPLCIAQRSYALFIYPFINLIIRHVLDLLYYIPFIKAGEKDISEFLINLNIFTRKQTVYYGNIFTISVFLGILLLGLKNRRYWCRNICPLGAILGISSYLSFYNRRVSDKCTVCHKCRIDCKMNAISDTCTGTLKHECIKCFNCAHLCPEKAISFNLSKGNINEINERSSSAIVTRRDIIKGGALGIIALPALKLDSSGKNHFFIRPPGSVKEELFKNTCIRCGTCMKICPTNAIQPVLFEAGPENLWTPRIIPRIGACSYECNLCGQVCPTNAIKYLLIEEKKETKIGLACINTGRCIPYTRDENCMICEAVCPLPEKAIVARKRIVKVNEFFQEIESPSVNPELCTGCGICENKCPVKGNAAIYITAI